MCNLIFKQSVTDCNHLETIDLDSRCVYGAVKDAEPSGNSAKMREALEKCANYLNVGDAGLCKGECDAMREVMQEALSAPPRNCDIYATIGEALDAFYEYQKARQFQPMKFYRWLFAEAKGEGK